MKIHRFLIFVTCWFSFSSFAAEDSRIFEHQAQVDMKLFGMETTASMTLTVSRPQDQSENLLIKLTGDPRPLIAGLPAHIEREVDARHRGCRERWDGRNAAANIEDTALSLRVTVSVEKWLCEKMFGSDVKTKLASETGTVNAALGTSVSDGRLQVTLRSFSVSGLSGLSRELNVEGMLRDELEAEIRKFNTDTETTKLSSPWAEKGFRLEDVVLSEHPQPSVTVRVSGPNDAVALFSMLKHLGN